LRRVVGFLADERDRDLGPGDVPGASQHFGELAQVGTIGDDSNPQTAPRSAQRARD
jgi:hypothetical protein